MGTSSSDCRDLVASDGETGRVAIAYKESCPRRGTLPEHPDIENIDLPWYGKQILDSTHSTRRRRRTRLILLRQRRRS